MTNITILLNNIVTVVPVVEKSEIYPEHDELVTCGDLNDGSFFMVYRDGGHGRLMATVEA